MCECVCVCVCARRVCVCVCVCASVGVCVCVWGGDAHCIVVHVTLHIVAHNVDQL